MAKKNEESVSEVHIGNVTGGITNSIIAGRDVTNATITVGGKPVPANRKPTFEELKQLLIEVQQELADIVFVDAYDTNLDGFQVHCFKRHDPSLE